MKFTLVTLLGLVAVACSAPAENPQPKITLQENQWDPNGSYNFRFETENGIKQEEQGQIKDNGEEGTAFVQGRYSYYADDGSPVEVTYTADENGFRPAGSHLPQAPAIPEAILRALEWIALHPEEDSLGK